MYRCVACHRRLLEPAYTAPPTLGAWMLGPVCMERERAAGRLPRPVMDRPARKRKVSAIPAARQIQALPGQLDFWEYNPAF